MTKKQSFDGALAIQCDAIGTSLCFASAAIATRFLILLAIY